jgi:hypothetical protein
VPALRRPTVAVTAAGSPDPVSVRSPLVAAVLANLEERPGDLRDGLSRADFRDLVRARGRDCDEAWAEISRAARTRETSEPVRRPITDPARRAAGIRAWQSLRLIELEAENERLRQLVSEHGLLAGAA